jgi:hypothetical protein
LIPECRLDREVYVLVDDAISSGAIVIAPRNSP